jgi:hypothetical protein
MRLHDLCEVFDPLRFPGATAPEHPERDAVLAAREAVTTAVRDEEFLLDCVAHELASLEAQESRRGLKPFFTLPGTGIAFAFGYHPPGGRPGPHEHTAWTITAVCRNRLEILTFDRGESYRRRELVSKNRFQAESGRVGYSYEPCIHEPRNHSPQWSLSFHVVSPRDGERPHGDEQPPPPGLRLRSQLPPVRQEHPYAYVQAARQRQAFVRELSRLITSPAEPRARDLLAKCYRLGPPKLRRLIDATGRERNGAAAAETSWTLVRAHAGLNLDYRCAGDAVTLYVETPDGSTKALTMHGAARAAIAMAATESSFDVCELPGNLSGEEQILVAEALEKSGLYKRRWR